MHFIYVKQQDDKEKMLSLGYHLLKEDEKNQIWVFANRKQAGFSTEDELKKADVVFLLSDLLTF